MEERVSLRKLFFAFAKIGAVTFGGGYAMLPILKRDIVEKYKWCTEEDILDYFAVGQCTPGIIAVNTATFIGYKTRGKTGAVIATLGLIFPSVVIISVIFHLLNAFESNIYVKKALSGIQAAVAALITYSAFTLAKKSIVNTFTFLLALISFLIMLFLSPSPVYIVLAALLIGVGLVLFKRKTE